MRQAPLWEKEDAAVIASPENRESADAKAVVRGKARVKAVDRGQTFFRMVIIEHLIEEEHPARAIWEFVSGLDLERFKAPIRAVEGIAGREAWDPQLLASLWIYAYSRGIGSAREIARRCEYDPGFQWITGMQKVNHHTLSDFRVEHGAMLDELFAQALGALSAEGLVTLERVTHDGTKIQANAGADSFRREERLEKHLQAARDQVAAMGDPREDGTVRARAARERARRERVEKLEHALDQLKEIRRAKQGEEAKAQSRASMTDPEARVMVQGDGGYAPSYNAQISTDAAHGIVVGVRVSQSGSDYGELLPAVERVEENLGRAPGQVVVDGGFTSRENIMGMAEKDVDLIGSLGERDEQTAGVMKRHGVDAAFYPNAFAYDEPADEYRCPAGKVLRHAGQERRIGVVKHAYRAGASDCAACPWKMKCCPQNEAKGRSITRAVEAPAVEAFTAKMKTTAARAIYRLRGAVAEFPNAWIKEKMGLRRFHVRGLRKAHAESIWVCLTFNILQWMRLRWLPARAHRGMASAPAMN